VSEPISLEGGALLMLPLGLQRYKAGMMACRAVKAFGLTALGILRIRVVEVSGLFIQEKNRRTVKIKDILVWL